MLSCPFCHSEIDEDKLRAGRCPQCGGQVMWEDEGASVESVESLFTVTSLPPLRDEARQDAAPSTKPPTEVSPPITQETLPGRVIEEVAPGSPPPSRDSQDRRAKTPTENEIPSDAQEIASSNVDDSQATLQHPTPHLLPGYGTPASSPGPGTPPVGEESDIFRTLPRREDTQRSISARDLSPAEMQRVGELWRGTYTPTSSPHRTIKNTGLGSEQATEAVVVKTRIVREEGAASFERPDYTLLDKIGEGGVGIVYAAKQTSINRTVALKMLRTHMAADADAREKFLAEAVVTGELDHPNIVPVYDLGADERGAHFYAMKRVEGTPWSSVIGQKTLAANLDILMKVADAIAFAHSRGVIHRDLKPENIMLGHFGEVLVMDWGIALSTSSFLRGDSVTQSNSMGGTPAYMAPEMATGPLNVIGPRSDVYLLGALLFEILTGMTPHAGHDVLSCLKAAARNEIQLCDVEGELIDIAYQAMATDPKDRYPDVHSFQDAIRTYESHSESISLAARADEDLRQARDTKDYQDFSRALFAYQEALALWPDNTRAAQGVEEAQLAYASTAHAKGDFDLGLSLLDEQRPSHRPLRRKLTEAQRERNLRQLRFRHLRRTAAGLVASIIVILSVGIVLVRIEQNKAQQARNIAEASSEQLQLANKALAERELDLQSTNEDLDQRRQELESANADLADREMRLTVALNETEEEKRRANRAAEAADRAKYVAQIGRAANYAEENAFLDVNRILETFAEPLQAHWRHWEWGRLSFLRGRAAHVSDALTARIERLAWIPNRQLLLVANAAGQVQIWDSVANAFWQTTLQLPGNPTSLAVSPDGQSVVAADASGGVIHLWPVDDLSDQDQPLPAAVQWPGHDAPVLSLRFSSDGQFLISSSQDGSVRLWDGRISEAPSRFVRQFMFDNAPVWDATLSPDNQHLYMASDQGYVGIWEVAQEGGLINRFTGHNGPVYALAVVEGGTPRRTHVISGGKDRFVMVWDPDRVRDFDYDELKRRLEAVQRGERPVATGLGTEDATPQVQVFSGHTAEVRTIQVAPDGRQFASGGHDNTVRVWSLDFARPQNSPYRVLRGHGGWVRSLVFHPDGRQIVSGGYDLQLKFWDVENYAESIELAGHEEAILTMAYSADGTRIITAGRDGTAIIWDAATGKPLQTLREGHEFLTSSASFFPDGDPRLVTSAGDGTTILWRLDTGVALHQFQGTGQNSVVDVSQDGRWIVTGSEGNDVLLWAGDARDEEPVPIRLSDHDHPVSVAAFCTDSDGTGAILFTGDEEGFGILWRHDPLGNRWERVRNLGNPAVGQPFTAARFVPHLSRLVTASAGGVVSQWQIPGGEELAEHRLQFPGAVRFLDTAPDGEHVAIVYRLRREAEGPRLQYRSLQPESAESPVEYAFEENVYSIAFEPGGEAIVFASEDPRFGVGRWKPGEPVPTPYWGAAVRSAVWNVIPSPDGTRLLTVGAAGARLWDIAARRRIQSFGPHQAILSAAFSPDGKQAVTAGSEGIAKIWDVASGKVIAKLPPVPLHNGEASPVFSVQFSPVPAASGARIAGDEEEALLVSSYADGTARVWSVRGEVVEQLRVLEHAPRELIVGAAAFSPDGHWIVTGAADGSATAWNGQTGELMQPLTGRESHLLAITHLAYSPDGTLLATASDDNSAIIWNVETWASRQRLEGHTAAVTAVSFSPDNRRLLTSSRDGTGKLWDTETGDEVFTVKGHTEEVTAASFSPDGRTVATAGADRRTILWPADNVPATLRWSSDPFVHDQGQQGLDIPLTWDTVFHSPFVQDYAGCRLVFRVEPKDLAAATASVSEELIPLSRGAPAVQQGLLHGEEQEIWLAAESEGAAEARRVASWAAVSPTELEFMLHDAADRRSLELLMRSIGYRAQWDDTAPDTRLVQIELYWPDGSSLARAEREIQFQKIRSQDDRADQFVTIRD
jgi:WD40 repeat protein/serine/threonine protein kinase